MRRALLLLSVIGSAWTLGSLPATPQETSDRGPVRAVIELNRRFYYAGDPFSVRISIRNDGDDKLANPVKTPLFKGFQVRSGGEAIDPTGTASVAEPTRPDKLSPSSFYGSVVDLTDIYPELREPGEFEIEWTADGVRSDRIVVKMIPKYDPAKEYRARLETDEGTIVIEFLGDVAPLAVKNFIDLANAEFYDEITFHEIRSDAYIVGGDPTATGGGGAGYSYPAELSALPVVAGTVLMKPVSPSPPSNSSQFVIMLRPEPAWTGQFTVFAQVIDGLDVVRRISRLPSTQQSSQPYFKPLKEIRVRRVAVEEKASAAPQAEAGADSRGSP